MKRCLRSTGRDEKIPNERLMNKRLNVCLKTSQPHRFFSSMTKSCLQYHWRVLGSTGKICTPWMFHQMYAGQCRIPSPHIASKRQAYTFSWRTRSRKMPCNMCNGWMYAIDGPFSFLRNNSDKTVAAWTPQLWVPGYFELQMHSKAMVYIRVFLALHPTAPINMGGR